MMKRLSILVALVSIVSCQNQQPELFYLQDGIVKLKEDTTSVGSVGKLNGMRYKVVDNDMLKEWVMNNAQGKDKNLNVCTSKITNMSGIFDENPYDENGDLKQNMGISFNRDISLFSLNLLSIENLYEKPEQPPLSTKILTNDLSSSLCKIFLN